LQGNFHLQSSSDLIQAGSIVGGNAVTIGALEGGVFSSFDFDNFTGWVDGGGNSIGSPSSDFVFDATGFFSSYTMVTLRQGVTSGVLVSPVVLLAADASELKKISIH